MNDLLAAGSILGDYEVLGQIGRGGMGVVYQARQLTLDRSVAIKVLAPELCSDHEYVDRFLREARAAAHLNHSNIIQIYDAGVCDDIYFFVMEFVDGKNLGQVLRRVGRFTEHDALQMVGQAARGLSFAHRAGMVHRDVKPENLMLTNEGSVKIGDLGLAKWKPNEYDADLTRANTTMGTPFYISPEQIRGVKNIDSRADIYSLGMTLYHFLAGRPAFGNGTPPEIMAQHLSDNPPSLLEMNPAISKPTIDLISEMIAKKREERIPEMAAVEERIREITGDRGEDIIQLDTPPPMQGITDPPGFWSAFPHLLGTGLAVLAIFMVGLILWKINRKHPSNKPPKEEPMAQSPVKPLSTPENKPAPVPKPAVAVTPQLGPIIPTPEKPKITPPKEPPPPAEQATGKTPAVEAKTENLPSNKPTEPPPTAAFKSPEPKKPSAPLPPENPFVKLTFQGHSDIRDFTIRSKSPPPDPEKIRPSMLNYVELEVGKLNAQESKALVTSALFNPDNLTHLSQNISNCVEATLEITPEYYDLGQGAQPGPFDSLEIEVTRVLKDWSQNLPDPDEWFHRNTDGQSSRKERGGFPSGTDPAVWLENCMAETDWFYASKNALIRWGSPGANSIGFDYDSHGDHENKSLPIADNPMGKANITMDSIGKPLRFNILPDLKRLVDEASDAKPMKHYGWLIQTVRGSGRVHFFSSLNHDREGPRIILKIRKKQKNEGQVSEDESKDY